MIQNEPPKSSQTHASAVMTESRVDNSLNFDSIQGQSRLNSKYELLSGYLDGELTQQEAQKVMLLLDSDAEYKKLHEEMLAMRHEVQSLSLQESELQHLDKLFSEPVAKSSRIFGFALIAISAVVIVGFILFSVFINAAISLLLKISIAILAVGGLFLLFSVLRQRMIASKSDKYNRVKI